MPEPRLPRGALPLATEAAGAAMVTGQSTEAVAFAALMAALPVIQRDAVRQAARHILALDAADRRAHAPGTPNKGPWNDMQTTLRRLARGEPMPDLPRAEPTSTEGEPAP
jgi:hypothetical protein